VENIGQIIIFLISLYGAGESFNTFSLSNNEYANNQNKFFPKLPYMAGKLLGLLCLIFFISIMEKMLFYPNVDITISLKFAILVVLAFSISIIVKKKIKK